LELRGSQAFIQSQLRVEASPFRVG